MVYSNVLEAIGNTPMIKLSKIVPEDCADVLVKYEGVNIGGSIKTRTAYSMICEAEKKGIINIYPESSPIGTRGISSSADGL